MRLLPLALAAGSAVALGLLLTGKTRGRKLFGDFSDPDLNQTFDAYNKRYFAGQLPKVRCVFADDLRDNLGHSMVGHMHWRPPDSLIEVSSLFSGASALSKMTLLHEMVHLKFHALDYERERKRIGHGTVFEKEMQRLAAAGAFKGLW